MIVIGISGSLRSGSHNSALLRAFGQCLGSAHDFAVFDQAKAIPVFDEDLEAKGLPNAVETLCRQIATADLAVFSTPEYNQSLPGSMKNMLDWVSRWPDINPLADKPCAVVGATVGPWGTRIAQQQLATVLWTCGARVLGPRLYHAKAGSGEIEALAISEFARACVMQVGNG